MITNLGKVVTLNNLSQGERSLVSHIAVGSVGTTATANDLSMAAEWARAEVKFIVADQVGGKLLIKAVLPSTLEGKIYEIGAYVSEEDEIDQVLTTFESFEGWTGTFTTANTRAGAESLSITATASATVSSTISSLLMDILTGAKNDDVFRFAVNVSNSNCNWIDYMFKENSSNYAVARIIPSAGYNVYSVNRSALTVTGTPVLSNIQELTVSVNAKSAGSVTVDLDFARIDAAHNSVSGTVLVARQELSVPAVKVKGIEQEIETSIGVFV